MLYSKFANNKTRLVCARENVNIVGHKVVEKYVEGSTDSDNVLVYNAWEQLFGETIMYSEVLYALVELEKDANMDNFVKKTNEWLFRCRRIREVRTGAAILFVWFVEVKDNGTITKILNK